jgi:hypothetical protein
MAATQRTPDGSQAVPSAKKGRAPSIPTVTFGSVDFGVLPRSSVVASTKASPLAPTAANLTARIENDSSNGGFGVVAIATYREYQASVSSQSQLPGGHSRGPDLGVQYHLDQVSRSDGVTPCPVETGQLVTVSISFTAPKFRPKSVAAKTPPNRVGIPVSGAKVVDLRTQEPERYSATLIVEDVNKVWGLTRVPMLRQWVKS